MKKITLVLLLGVFVLSVNSQIIVPLTLPDNCNVTVGITEQLRDITPKLTLFPNPNDGNFTATIISPKVIDNVEIVVFNSMGVECYLKKVYCNSNNLVRQVVVSDFPAGVYFIKVRSDSFNLSRSFIIHK
jgi:hypothetical protein